LLKEVLDVLQKEVLGMREINKVAVLGAGFMGSTIAVHLVNDDIEVLLLDLLSTIMTQTK